MVRKIICLILIAGLLPAICAGANEPKPGYINDEMQILKENGIIKGDPNGDLRPDDELTRAEFAVILCRVMGVEELARTDGMIGKEYFKDVTQTHWAAGYINTAAEYRAINGYEDRTFRPEQSVTNEQAVKMLVGAWGYGGEAEKLGGYPDGYMEIARRYGVTDTVLFNYGVASKRWVACAFTYGALNMPVSGDAAIEIPVKIEHIGFSGAKPENTDYVEDAVSILKKITPASAKYERKVFEQSVPAEYMPFAIQENKLVFDDHTEKTGDIKIRVYISEQGVKQPFVDEYFARNSVDLTLFSIPAGDWQCQLAIIDGAVKDTYFVTLRKSANDTIEFTGDIYRYTTLNAQPTITEEREDLTVSGKQVNDLYPFAILPLADDNANYALSVAYLSVLPANYRFSAGINSMDLYYPPARSEDGYDMSGIYSAPIQGENLYITPIIFYDLKLNADYHIQVSVLNLHGEGVSLKGNIRLYVKNGNIDYIFEGSVRTIEIKSYEITKYDFDTVEFMPDSGSGLRDSALAQDGEMIFEPVNITNSWLADLAGGGAVKVNVGMLNFGDGAVVERYIDIKGANGEVRLLQNSSSDMERYDKTLFWSAKQQAGTTVVKDFNGEIKCAVLFELPDGSCYLYGYSEYAGRGAPDYFWRLEVPTSNYYRYIK